MDLINKLIWAIAVSFLTLSSVYYSFRLRFVQVNFLKIFSCFKRSGSKDGISAGDSLIMSLSSKIGVGSLAGISFAIYYGGLGSIFWIWVITFFTSINCYVENILAILYKKTDKYECQGGPFYYIKNGLGKKWLAVFYAILAIASYSTGFIAIQNNTMTILLGEMYNVNVIFVSFLITVLSSFIFLRGIKTVSNFCNKIFPIMMVIYLFVGLLVFLDNVNFVPTLFINIMKSAFSGDAMSGGIIYILLIGFQKGIFQTEAGVGTSAMISGMSNNNDYIKQGNMGIVSTYFIGFVISSVTALIVSTSDFGLLKGSSINGIELTKYAFNYHFGYFGEVVLLIILVLFAFSTIVTVYYYALNNLKGLTNKKLLITILKVVTILSLFIGGIVSSSFVWKMIDIFVGLLTIINTYSIFMLRDVIVDKVRSSN